MNRYRFDDSHNRVYVFDIAQNGYVLMCKYRSAGITASNSHDQKTVKADAWECGE